MRTVGYIVILLVGFLLVILGEGKFVEEQLNAE